MMGPCGHRTRTVFPTVLTILGEKVLDGLTLRRKVQLFYRPRTKESKPSQWNNSGENRVGVPHFARLSASYGPPVAAAIVSAARRRFSHSPIRARFSRYSVSASASVTR